MPKNYLKKFKIGSFEVKIYSASRDRAFASFYDLNGNRVRIERKTVSQAEGDARDKISKITSADYLQSQSAEELLAPLGVSVLEAARFYLRHHSGTGYNKKINEVWNEMQEMLLRKERCGELSRHYVHDLKVRITPFVNKFGEHTIGKIGKIEIADFIEARCKSPRSKRNQRAAIVALFRFAQQRTYLKEGPTVVDQIKNPKESVVIIEFFSPDEMILLLEPQKKLLKGQLENHKKNLPLFLLGGFAGIRTEEMTRPTQVINNKIVRDSVRWEDFLWQERQLFIRPEVAKVAEGRYVPLSDNLMAWLKPYRKQQGRIWNRNRADLAFALTAEQTGIRWKKNGLRHAYGTYRTAIVKSIPQVALEMGNSVQMVKRHYQRPIPESIAKKWFEIYPTLPAS